MPEYLYAEHGSLTPYLSLYPGLFGFYDSNVFVSNKAKPPGMPSRRESHNLRWMNSKSRFSSPTNGSSRTSSTRSSAPYLYTFYDDESSQTSPPQVITPTRLAKPVIIDIGPSRRPSTDRKRRATPEREPSGRSSKRERSSSDRRKPSKPAATFFIDRGYSYISPRASCAEPVITYIDASPQTPSPRPRSDRSYVSPPINPTPAQPLRRKPAQALPRLVPLTDSPPPYVQRRNAIRRDGKVRAVPVVQTDPAIPLPELSKLDKLLDQIAKLVASATTSVSSTTRTPKPLSQDLQSKLCDLVAYQAASWSTLLPDQNAPAARWHSGLRLFPGIKNARDKLSRYDGLSMNPPKASSGSAARFRALQRIIREPNTAARQSLVPSIMAVVAAQTTVRHVLAAIEAKGQEIGNPYRVQQSRQRRKDAGRMHSGAWKGESRPPKRVVESRWDPDSSAGVELGLPTPLALRVRRLERMDLRLQRVANVYADTVWRGKGDCTAWLAWVRETMVYEGFLK